MANIAQINQEVQLGLQVGSVLIPAISGIIRDIKANRQADGSIEYVVAISTGQANLDKAATNFTDSILAIDAQLADVKQLTNAAKVAGVLHNPA